MTQKEKKSCAVDKDKKRLDSIERKKKMIQQVQDQLKKAGRDLKKLEKEEYEAVCKEAIRIIEECFGHPLMRSDLEMLQKLLKEEKRKAEKSSSMTSSKKEDIGPLFAEEDLA